MQRRSDSGNWMHCFTFPLVILFLSLFVFTIAENCIHEYVIKNRGMITDGTAFVTECVPNGRGYGYTYYIRYNFKYGSTTYKGRWPVQETWAHATKMPTRIRVQFMSGNPALNWPLDVGIYQPLWPQILIALAILSLMIFIIMRIIRYVSLPKPP